MGQQAAWLCPQQRIQAGKPLHLRLPSLLSEPRRNSAMAKVTAFMRRGILRGRSGRVRRRGVDGGTRNIYLSVTT
jgi:hypothetical protein